MLGAIRRVELPQALAQPMRFHANDRIPLLIEIGGAAQRFDRYVIFLDLVPGTLEVLRAHVAQQVRQVRGSVENPRSQQRFEFLLLLFKRNRSAHPQSRDPNRKLSL